MNNGNLQVGNRVYCFCPCCKDDAEAMGLAIRDSAGGKPTIGSQMKPLIRFKSKPKPERGD